MRRDSANAKLELWNSVMLSEGALETGYWLRSQQKGNRPSCSGRHHATEMLDFVGQWDYITRISLCQNACVRVGAARLHP